VTGSFEYVAASLACAVTLFVAYLAVRPFFGVSITSWDSLFSPRVGRWFDLAGAIGVMFVMLGWFVPRTVGGLMVWVSCVMVGALLGTVAMKHGWHGRTHDEEEAA
jgi:uncharacterized membrane protein YdcZ (DUF606 family)